MYGLKKIHFEQGSTHMLGRDTLGNAKMVE